MHTFVSSQMLLEPAVPDVDQRQEFCRLLIVTILSTERIIIDFIRREDERLALEVARGKEGESVKISK